MENLFFYIETYQTLIAGIGGFTGVALTMRANAHFQRAQHNRVIQHEKRAFRNALKAELNTNKEMCEYRIEQFNTIQDGLVPTKVENCVYNALLGKIGILEPDEISAIIGAYQMMIWVLYSIRILSGADAGRSENEAIYLKSEHVATVKKLHDALLAKILVAIEFIDRFGENA